MKLLHKCCAEISMKSDSIFEIGLMELYKIEQLESENSPSNPETQTKNLNTSPPPILEKLRYQQSGFSIIVVCHKG